MLRPNSSPSNCAPHSRPSAIETVAGQVWVNDAHARWIRSLLGRGVDVGWATTWEHYANEVFSPLLGVPALPLAAEFHADVRNRHHRNRRVSNSLHKCSAGATEFEKVQSNLSTYTAV